ncbi:MAG: dimethylsulfonioproprionate lyase family protein [Geminicoccaceae bacterium]
MASVPNPDWLYLLREFDLLYRRGSAGGSKPIRTHMRQVRGRIARLVRQPLRHLPRDPYHLPVSAHWPRAIDLALPERTGSFARLLDRLASTFTWEYGYAKVPGNLRDAYAFTELAGPRGPIAVDDLILGLVLFAPRCVYPQHRHTGITESYVVVSGTLSENDVGVYAPGSLIFNPPNHFHRITVGDREPCLLAYAWVGEAQDLAAPHMIFERAQSRLASGK